MAGCCERGSKQSESTRMERTSSGLREMDENRNGSENSLRVLNARKEEEEKNTENREGKKSLTSSVSLD